jgi:hypothetical protein
MGKTLVNMIAESGDLELGGALEASGHPDLGADAGVLAGVKALGVQLTDDALSVLAKADALIDFTIPKVSVELAALSAQARITHVIGTTGCSVDDEAKFRAAARHAVIVKSISASALASTDSASSVSCTPSAFAPASTPASAPRSGWPLASSAPPSSRSPLSAIIFTSVLPMRPPAPATTTRSATMIPLTAPCCVRRNTARWPARTTVWQE